MALSSADYRVTGDLSAIIDELIDNHLFCDDTTWHRQVIGIAILDSGLDEAALIEQANAMQWWLQDSGYWGAAGYWTPARRKPDMAAFYADWLAQTGPFTPRKRRKREGQWQNEAARH